MAAKKSEDIRRAELERQSRDLYKVYNPSKNDFTVTLNKKVNPETWVIHAKQEEIVPKYVRDMYLTKMVDKIIYTKTDKAVIEENKKRMKKGFEKMDLHTEQFRFESRRLKNLQGKREKLIAILDKGLHKEYGVAGGTKEYDDLKEKLEITDEIDEALDEKRVDSTPDTPKEPKDGSNEASEAKFKCDVCGFEAKTKAGLSAHQRSHQTATP